MTTNINVNTGIAYGYIASNALDSEVVDELMFGPDAVDVTYQDNILEFAKSLGFYGEDHYTANIWLENNHPDKYYELQDYGIDEHIVNGNYEGVLYCSSWLGGALNFFIFNSPTTTDKARRASPCVPNCGILDTLDGDVSSYDVPEDWRTEEY